MFRPVVSNIHLVARTAVATSSTSGVVAASRVFAREYASSTPANQSIFKSLSSWLSKVGKKTTAGQATALFHNCQQQATKSHWQQYGLIGNDFRSKHMLLVLHVWMVHKRLLQEGKQGLLVQEALFDELWEDTANRIRGQGIMEISVNKYLKEVQSYSFRFCVELDHILDRSLKLKGDTDNNKKMKVKGGTTTTSTPPSSSTLSSDLVEADEEEQILDDIGGALWRLLYLKREDLDLEHIMELVKYVRREQLSLLQLDREAIFEGRILWGDLPRWKKVKHNSTTSSSVNHEQIDGDVSTSTTAKKGEWKEATAPDGRMYYWNTLTRESRWDKPKDE